MDWISNNLPPSDTWPGNVRELEQCVRNVMVRGCYEPELLSSEDNSDVMGKIELGVATLEDLTRSYCTQTYHRLGNYEAAARHLGVDSRTLKSKIDRKLLREL